MRLKILSFLDEEGKETILPGDTNFYLTIWAPALSTNSNPKHICSLHELIRFKQLIEEQIRVTPYRSTILDHIAKKSPSTITGAAVHNLL